MSKTLFEEFKGYIKEKGGYNLVTVPQEQAITVEKIIDGIASEYISDDDKGGAE